MILVIFKVDLKFKVIEMLVRSCQRLRYLKFKAIEMLVRSCQRLR